MPIRAERARLTPTAQAGGGPTAQAKAYASRARWRPSRIRAGRSRRV